MQIPLVAGAGVGSTLLSAFDDALLSCGVLNYNLIPLSSVIPPASNVVLLPRYTPHPDEHGHRLYVVKAEMRSDHAGTQIGAGIGWYQWGDGRGVFVEHETIGSTRQEVAAELDYRICHSLRDLCAARRSLRPAARAVAARSGGSRGPTNVRAGARRLSG